MFLIVLILIFLGLIVIVDGISETPIMGCVKDPLLGGFYFLNYCRINRAAQIKSDQIRADKVLHSLLVKKVFNKIIKNPIKLLTSTC